MNKEEILHPIWDRWHNTNEISSKELCILVWNAAIDLAAESATLTCEDFGDRETIINTKSITDLKF